MSYPAVLPTILDAIGGRPLGTTVLARELAELTGRNFSQIRSAISHANATGRVVMIERAGEETAWVWNGLGPNAKKVDHTRVDTAQLKAAGELPRMVDSPRLTAPTDAAALAAVQTVGSYALRDAAARDAAKSVEIPALYESVRPLKGGKILLQDELGNLWVARALDHL